MAQNPQRVTSASRSTSQRRNTRSQTSRRQTSSARKNTKKQNSLIYEIIVMTLVFFAIFLSICVYFNAGGVVGRFFRGLFFGLFGIGAYFMPVYILGASVFKIFNKNNARLNNKLSLLFLWIMSLSVFSHVIYINGAQINKSIMGKSTFFPTLVNYFSLSSKKHFGGGFVGGLFGDFLAVLLGKIGSILVLVLIMLSILILLTEQSFFTILKQIFVKIQSAVTTVYSRSKEAIDDVQKRRIEENENRRKPVEEVSDFEMQIENQEKRAKKRENFLKKATIPEPEVVQNDISNVQEYEEDTDFNPVEEEMIEEVALSAEPIISEPIVQEEKKTTPQQMSLFGEPTETKKKIEQEIKETPNKSLYEFPPMQLLKDNPLAGVRGSRDSLRRNADKLEKTLESFGVKASVVNISSGPTVTRYELQPEVGVKVSRIVNLSDDIALNLAASGIRIEAPIPGKSLIGIEVPNKEVGSVYIKEVLDTDEFKKHPSKIAIALGKDISGETIIADIARMPHMLISGSTGSGKSVCINTLITSIIYKANPNDVKLLMIDPKVVELKVYDGIPHLLIPVVTDPKKAAGALYWAVQEMSERYQLFANANVRDLNGYNKMVEESGELKKLPQIVIIVDELADLMQVAAKDVEEAICRLAQMARAAGIHLILATQRPSVDVITGIIKANIPSRIAFKVTSGIDSRTILDTYGAEKLVGKGDMLYFPSGLPKPIRVQGAFISDKEVESIVEFLKASQKASYNTEIIEKISKESSSSSSSGKAEENADDDTDSRFDEALQMVVEMQKASASMIQRRFRVGYNRAARIIDQLYEAGYIGPDEGSKPRKVNITMEEYLRMKHQKADSKDEEAELFDE